MKMIKFLLFSQIFPTHNVHLLLKFTWRTKNLKDYFWFLSVVFFKRLFFASHEQMKAGRPKKRKLKSNSLKKYVRIILKPNQPKQANALINFLPVSAKHQTFICCNFTFASNIWIQLYHIFWWIVGSLQKEWDSWQKFDSFGPRFSQNRDSRHSDNK